MGDRGRGSNAPSTKGRGSHAPAAKRGGSNASTPSLDWAEEMNAEDDTTATDEDNTQPTTGGRGGVRGVGRGGENSKRDRSQSSNRTEEQVPAKRGGA